MNREAINITITDPLRRAQVKPRLDALSRRSGLPVTQLAGRAMTLGIGLIESDLRQIFPGEAEHSEALSPPATSSAAPPSQPRPSDTPPRAAERSADVQRAADTSAAQPDPATPLTASPALPSLPVAEPDPAPRTRAQPERVSTAEAASALGYREPSAFFQHCQRHPELKSHSRKNGRVRMWDLPKLRAEYERNGWTPK
jgi:hypothetical protein